LKTNCCDTDAEHVASDGTCVNCGSDKPFTCGYCGTDLLGPGFCSFECKQANGLEFEQDNGYDY